MWSTGLLLAALAAAATVATAAPPPDDGHDHNDHDHDGDDHNGGYQGEHVLPGVLSNIRNRAHSVTRNSAGVLRSAAHQAREKYGGGFRRLLPGVGNGPRHMHHHHHHDHHEVDHPHPPPPNVRHPDMSTSTTTPKTSITPSSAVPPEN